MVGQKDQMTSGYRRLARNARAKRLPLAPNNINPNAFKASAADWQRIESAYGVKLSDEHRSNVTSILNEYLVEQHFAMNAGFVKDSIEWLVRFRKALDQLFEKFDQPNDEPSGANFYAQIALINEFCSRPPWKNWGLDKLSKLIADLRAASDKVTTVLQDKGNKLGFDESATWSLMIRDLSDFAKTNGFPFRVSKGFDKSMNISPFVRFTRELQNTIPDEYRRYHTDQSLATAIVRARPEPRDASIRLRSSDDALTKAIKKIAGH